MNKVLIILVLIILNETSFCASVTDSIYKACIREKDPVKKSDLYLSYLGKLSAEFRDSASRLCQKAETEYERKGFKYGLARAQSLQSWFLLYLEKNEESLKKAHKALLIQKEIRDTFGMALTLNRIGIAHLHFKRYKDSGKYITESFNLFLKLKDTLKIDMTLNNLGVLAYEQKQYSKAISYYHQTLAIRKARREYYWIAYACYNLGDAYQEAGNTDSAGFYLLLSDKIFRTGTEKKKVPALVNLAIGKYYSTTHEFKKALTYAQNGLEDAKMENHIDVLNEAMPLVSELMFKTGLYKQAFLLQKEYNDFKVRLDSINNAETAAEIEEKYRAAEKEAEISKLKANNLEAENKAQLRGIYAITASAVLLLSGSLFVLIFQRRKQTEKIRTAELNAAVSEARILALRAQMNPHFVFNCINTAQNFIVNNQKEKAYEYLADFARLLRLVLENSAKIFVPLEDEIILIKLYTELESIRFENRFEVNLNIEPQLESGVFEIPGMILQPLIENAIGHGLINRKDNQGKLNISIELNGETIVCIIEDNGVGREAAAIIKEQKRQHFKSTATPNIRERLSILEKVTGNAIQLSLIDLYENGMVAGTQVNLVLPYR